MDEILRVYERKIQDTYNELDRTHLREMQKKMYHCAATCCDNSSDSTDYVQSCIDRCTVPFQTAQQTIKHEFEDFQQRVQRCILVCNDQTKELMEKKKLSDLNDEVKANFDKCAGSCITKHIEMLPALVSKLKDILKRNESQLIK